MEIAAATIVEVDGDEFELRGPPELQAVALRALFGTTPLDRAVDAQPIPRLGPRRLVVRSLRWYRRCISPRLGDRCVMDPSCSRYGEQAVRHRGVLRGAWLTIGRLRVCRPEHGGFDLPHEWMPADAEQNGTA